MGEIVLIGVIAASGAYLLLLYRQVAEMEERLRHMVESTEQRLVDAWDEVKYLRPGEPPAKVPAGDDEEEDKAS